MLKDKIKIGDLGIVKVHSLFEEMPEFMKKADCVFTDPPADKGNMKRYYTKLDRKPEGTYSHFLERLFEWIDAIAPKHVFIEVFKANKEQVRGLLQERFKHLTETPHTYYFSKKYKCYIIHGTNEATDFKLPEGIDEERAIEWVCKNLTFDCIADPCMGQGLVGYYAHKYGKQFVGTELNPTRLEILSKRIEAGSTKIKAKHGG